MRIKFIAIYILAGAAFLGVSLWAFLSNGKSARALRYKYKLGGVMLTALAMLSAAACEGEPLVTCYEPVVTCYDPAPPEDTTPNRVEWGINPGGNYNKLGSRDYLIVHVKYPTYYKYCCRVTATPDEGEPFVIQEKFFYVLDNEAKVTIHFNDDEYLGDANFTVIAMLQDEEGNYTVEGEVIATNPLIFI